VTENQFIKWRRNFFAGLAIVLPGVISAWLIIWLFFTVSKITDTLLIFIPKAWTHEDSIAGPGTGSLHWYWSLVALFVAILIVSIVGLLTRNYVGQRFLDWIDASLLRVPLFNKVYGATKQLNDAFASGNKTSFKTVVMVEYPRTGVWTVGFLTSEVHKDIECKMQQKVVCVFIPTTPNPTGGFLMLFPEADVIKLDMSVADGLKFIVSLGSIIPESSYPALQPPPAAGERVRS
jgi:uncharacterized membrane protein